MSEDDIPEEVKRGVEKVLFGERTGIPSVSVKKRFRFPGPSARVQHERQDAQMSVYEETKRGGD